MNIFRKIALQGLKKNRARTAVTIVGVILSAAMITSVFTFAVSLQDYLVRGAEERYGSWHVAFPDTDGDFVRRQTGDEDVASVVPAENIGYAKLSGGENPDKPYLFLTGLQKDAFDALHVELISGRLPENSSEILVPLHLSANGGVNLSAGDTLTLSVGQRVSGEEVLSQHDPYRGGKEKSGDGSCQTADGETLTAVREKTYTVVGICQRPSFEEYTAPGYTLITVADTPEKSSAAEADVSEVSAAEEDTPGRTRSLSAFVTLEDPGNVRSWAESASAEGGGDYFLNDNVLRFLGLSDDRTFNALLYSAGGILTVLIMLGSVFLIYNSFVISLNDRMRQFGILMSAGATERQLRGCVLFEGLCIGAVGIPAGILAGLPAISVILSLTKEHFSDVMYENVPLTLKISAPALAAAAAVSLATILISVYVPARKAASVPVMECIRQTNEVKLESKAMKTPKLTERLWGVEGSLALKNFRRNRHRYRSIVLSLTLSVVLFVSADTFGTYLSEAADSSVADSDYDICFYTEEMEETEVSRLYDELKTAEGVTDSSYQAMETVTCRTDAEDLSTAGRKEVFGEKGGTAPDSEAQGSGAPDTEGSEAGTAELSMDLQFIEDNIYREFAESLGLSAQSTELAVVAKVRDSRGELADIFSESSCDLTLYSASGEPSVTVTAVFADTYPVDVLPVDSDDAKPYVLMAVLPYSEKTQFDGLGATQKLGLTFVTDNSRRTAAQMREMIGSSGITAEYTFYNVRGIFDQNRNILFIVNLFTGVFIVMISLIAAANVFNTISTNIRLRRRELAMLRSVGMSDRSFDRMMCFECGLYGLRTLLIGLPLSAVLSWVIYKVLQAEIGFLFPWKSMVVSTLGVFLLIFITMLYAVRRIRRENIIDALRDDLL